MRTVTSAQLRKEGRLILWIGLALAVAHAALTVVHVDLQSVVIPSGWTEYALVAVSSCMSILLQAGPVFLTVGWVFLRLAGNQPAAAFEDEDEQEEEAENLEI